MQAKKELEDAMGGVVKTITKTEGESETAEIHDREELNRERCFADDEQTVRDAKLVVREREFEGVRQREGGGVVKVYGLLGVVRGRVTDDVSKRDGRSGRF